MRTTDEQLQRSVRVFAALPAELQRRALLDLYAHAWRAGVGFGLVVGFASAAALVVLLGGAP